ncbi:MAG TPA: hypothetical protein VIY48_09760 [Candidatus Paceibacterota bacterium]
MDNPPTPIPNHDAPPPPSTPKVSHKATPGRLPETALGQIKHLQKKLISSANGPKTTGNTLAQIARSWCMLEAHRARLLAGRSALRAPQSLDAMGAATGTQLGNPAEEAVFLESMPEGVEEQTGEGLPIELRKAPEHKFGGKESL